MKWLDFNLDEVIGPYLDFNQPEKKATECQGTHMETEPARMVGDVFLHIQDGISTELIEKGRRD